MSLRSLVIILALLAFAGCGAVQSQEEQTLERFFRASRLIDFSALAEVADGVSEDAATVWFDPRTDGSIQQLRIERVTIEDEEPAVIERVRFSANVQPPSGPMVRKTMTATLRKRDGRWVVAALER